MELLRATLLYFRMHLVRILRTRRMLLCLLGSFVPPLFAWWAMQFPEGPPRVEVFVYPGWALGIMVLVPIASLVAGHAVVSEEIDDRTITYLFTRPVPRAALLLGRWLATVVSLCAILAASVGLLYLVASHAGDAPAEALPAGLAGPLLVTAILGGLVDTALFTALGTFLKHPMIVGLGYTFAIEGFLAGLPGKSQALTIQHYLRSYLLAEGSSLWQKAATDVSPDQGILVLAASRQGAGDALFGLAVILLVALVVGTVTISRKQYVLPA